VVLIGIALLEVGWCVQWLGGIGQGGIRANLISEGQTDRAEQLPRWGLAGRRRSP
jgi:hypothetical protein